MKEKKILEIPHDNVKTPGNHTTEQKSHQMGKYTGCPARKILGTIL